MSKNQRSSKVSAPIQSDDLLSSEETKTSNEDTPVPQSRAEMRAEIIKELEETHELLPHQMEQVHESKEQTSRDSFEFDPAAFEDSGPLPNIPAREGYAQRWVRVSVKDKDDARNIANRSQRGWSPRQATTVNSALQHMLVNHQGLTGVIGTHDLILMERPIAIHKKVEEIERKKRRDLEKAVKGNIFNEHKRIGGSQTGFEAPVNESTSRVVRGSPRIADD